MRDDGNLDGRRLKQALGERDEGFTLLEHHAIPYRKEGRCLSAARRHRYECMEPGRDLSSLRQRGPDAFDRAWSLEIIDAIEQGIVVIFSAGNGTFSIEPQVPGVISAGGAFVNRALELRASNYASGYASPWFDGVDVPVVSGLVGELPRAQYLLLPIPPGCEIDVDESAPEDGDPPDGTSPRDGWALFSGTSAAAPMLAGVAALIRAAKPGLSPAAVRQAMVDTATDVVGGRCHPRFNQPAVAGPDLATGAGLVNAAAALQAALATD